MVSMAKPAAIKLLQGNPSKKPLPGTVKDGQPVLRDGPLEPPIELTEMQSRLWKRFVDPAWWLSEFDAPKAFIWVSLMAEYLEAPRDMAAPRISNLRVAGAELGFDPQARARAGLKMEPETKDPAEKYF